MPYIQTINCSNCKKPTNIDSTYEFFGHKNLCPDCLATLMTVDSVIEELSGLGSALCPIEVE
jgi:hypothetical protein